MVKCLTHGLRDFNGAVQRCLATLTVTMLVSSGWQLSSEVELRRILNVCKRWANSGSHEFMKKNMVRYMRPHGRFAHCSFWPLVSKYTIVYLLIYSQRLIITFFRWTLIQVSSILTVGWFAEFAVLLVARELLLFPAEFLRSFFLKSTIGRALGSF